MQKQIFLISVLLFSYSALSQSIRYLDSLSVAIENRTKKEQIEIITNLPYDKMVSDVKVFKVLTDKAIQYSKELRDTLLLADSYAAKTFVANHEERLQLSLKAIRFYEHLNLPDKVGGMYCSLGWQLKRRDFDKAFQYYQKGLNILENYKGEKVIDPIYDNYGVLLGMKHEWDSALFYHKKSLKIKKQLQDSVGIPFGYSHLANVYLNQNQYQKALQYLDSALIIRQRRKDIYGITDSYLYYGDLYFNRKDYKNAIVYFKKGYDLAVDYHFFPLKKYAAEYLYKSNDSLSNYKEALAYNLIFNTLKDSMLNVKTNSRIAELEIEYQTEKKEKEILSQRADIAEKELSLSKKNSLIMVLTALAVMLLLLGYLIYNQQKLKNRQLLKENELKDALLKIETQSRLQEQRLRISRDLHDNIGAQLTFIISSLDNLKYGFQLPEELNEKLRAISAFTTTTIYELRDTIWAMNKNELTFEDLKARISNYIDKADIAARNIRFEFNVDEHITTGFSSLVGINVYRIVQEVLNNAIKYAEAKKISVDIIKKNDNFLMVLKDDGKGFDQKTITYGNGLNNIKKRAQEAGMDIEIYSKPGSGTTVTLVI